MKTKFKNYIAAWAVLLVLFNVIAFVTPGWHGQEKYTASFWIGYICITICFVGQLMCARRALKETDKAKLFYKLPLISLSYTGLIASFIIGGACMLISPLPYWVGAVLCAALLAWLAIAVIKADTAAEIVAKADDKIKVQTSFIKSLTVDAESLMAKATTEEAKIACKKVYEALRYSDPMSRDALAGIEHEIRNKYEIFARAVSSGVEPVNTTVEEIIGLIGNRNLKCKNMK